MKEENLKNMPEGIYEFLAWLNRGRNIEEQDYIDQGESDVEEAAQHTAHEREEASKESITVREVPDPTTFRMKEESMKNKSKGIHEVLAWCNRSCKIEEKRNVEKEKAFQLSKIFDGQDNIDQRESDDEEGAQHTAQACMPDDEDVFIEEDDEHPVNEEKEEIVPDETIHEVPVGKGLLGALKLRKERGMLNGNIESGGLFSHADEDTCCHEKNNIKLGSMIMGKQLSRFIGICENDAPRPPVMRIETMDETMLIMTRKEALRRMRGAQARLKTPYLVPSGHVKLGQTSDSRSGFATIEKDLPGGLTPMLGDRKVEHFLGIKTRAEPRDMGSPKNPKT